MTAKLTELPTGIRRKLWEIQRYIQPVEADITDGDDTFKYAPAPAVFAEIRKQLWRRQLMVVPSVIGSTRTGQTTTVKLGIEVTDLEDSDSVDYTWEGESSEGHSAACTLALKGWYIATFLIALKEPSDEKKHAQRAARAKANPKVSASQIKHYIGPVKAESGLSEEEFAALLQELFGVDDVVLIPRGDADLLVKALRSRTKRKPQENSTPPEHVPVAAGPDTEPRHG